MMPSERLPDGPAKREASLADSIGVLDDAQNSSLSCILTALALPCSPKPRAKADERKELRSSIRKADYATSVDRGQTLDRYQSLFSLLFWRPLVV